MAWTEIQTIRNITGVSQDDYSDGEIEEFIGFAQKEVISKVQQKIIRETISYIDSTRKNEINGSNTTFYFSKWKGNYLGDMDYDGDIDTSDIIVYQITSDGTETILTPSSVNQTNMSFTLSSAPSNVTLQVTYTYSPYNFNSPDPMLTQMVSYLASSYLDITDGSNGVANAVRIGNLSISEGAAGSGLQSNKYYQKYQSLLNLLEENTNGGAIWGVSLVEI